MLAPASRKCRQMMRMAGTPMASMASLAAKMPSTCRGANWIATVIDSLAMLQSSQGKKVGVISHTGTMSERITTQIRIIKNGNSGSSHIEIYP